MSVNGMNLFPLPWT